MLKRAIGRIGEIPGVRASAVSHIYLTEPQDLKEQPWFANCVMRLACRAEVSPYGLLDELESIETEFGRTREVRFGPRSLDIDILLFGDRTSGEGRLILPHPRMRERAFVLLPLAELAPALRLPWGETPAEALSRLDYRCEGLRIWQTD
ncbi:2-amino-4-hydroxy-6-hydroxymethyldihydropteridine pyrophosphokinase [Desulfovibrio sp. X2]|nr:2-amino-4-hydroxy-6-hydroxymethyldihydropteridine pyrophosphokinase [Desulfovibrio sp. X2]